MEASTPGETIHIKTKVLHDSIVARRIAERDSRFIRTYFTIVCLMKNEVSLLVSSGMVGISLFVSFVSG